MFRKCPRDHQCRKMCHEECLCQELINEITNCGHIVQGKCSDIEYMKCDIKVYFFIHIPLTKIVSTVLVFDNCLCSRLKKY